MHDYMRFLGYKVRDAVTGFEGVVESVSFDLYGCVQAVVRGPQTEKGELPDGRWFDMKRLTLIGTTPVMPVPRFDAIPAGSEIGGSEKPARR